MVGTYSAKAAYVFVEPATGWANMTETAKLTASDGVQLGGAVLGGCLAISGNTVVAGAPHPDSVPGAAYVFVKPASGWANMTQTAKLTASDGKPDDQFGASVGVDGNAIVVGTNGAQPAYVFVEPTTGWVNMTQTARLTPSGGNPFQSGFSVAISGDTVVAGRTGDEAAYVFVKPSAGWSDMTQTAKLTSSDDAGFGTDHFGVSVALERNTVAVGAFAATIGLNRRQGAIYVFAEPGTGWESTTETAKLTTSDGMSGDFFGTSVAISGNTVVGGAPMIDGIGPGAAYVFGPTTVALSKTSLSFLVLRTVGTTSQTQTVKLTNVGSGELAIADITLTGPDPRDFAQSNNCPPTVASSASCLITVTFTPTAQGVRAASVSITDSAPGSPQTVPLSGRATFFEWAPRSLNMGDQKVGTSSAARAVTLTNAGPAPITLFSIEIAGVNPGDFSETNDCGGSLNAGASCTIEVTFTPTAVGGRLGHVAIRDSAFGGTHWVGLLGKGT